MNSDERINFFNRLYSLQLNALNCLNRSYKKDNSTVFLSLPGTHDLLEFIGESMCILMEMKTYFFHDVSALPDLKSNLEELSILNKISNDYLMNVQHGVSLFLKSQISFS